MSKVADFIMARAWVKEVEITSVKPTRIKVELEDGFVFTDTNETVAVFTNTRSAATGSSNNAVKNINGSAIKTAKTAKTAKPESEKKAKAKPEVKPVPEPVVKPEPMDEKDAKLAFLMTMAMGNQKTTPLGDVFNI